MTSGGQPHVVYKGEEITEPWDTKVVQCMYNVRGGIFISGTVFFLLSILLETSITPMQINSKIHLFIMMMYAIGSIFIFGSVVSEMDIMKRKTGSASIQVFDDYAKSFVMDYPMISGILMMLGALLASHGR